MFNLIICGSRSFMDFEFMKKKLDNLLVNRKDVRIISGTANGADKLGERYAADRGFPLNRYPANWEKYGKSAGYKRNEEMAGVANAVVAFWDGSSRGTMHMINIAKSKGLALRVIKY